MKKIALEEKHRLFKKAVEEIEVKYESYFKGRKSAYADRQDCINDHVMIMHAGLTSSINWKKETDLMREIRLEVENAFKTIYQS
jgi:hypothetical protein